MKNYTRKNWAQVTLLVMLAAILIWTLAACTSTTELTPLGSPSPSPSTLNPLTSLSPSLEPSGLNPLASPNGLPSPSEPPAAPTLSNQESAALAAQCDSRITRISEIEDSVTVMLGDTTLTGVSFIPQYKGELTTRVNGIIGDSVRTVAPSITTVKVTSDAALTARIAALHEKQKQGGSTTEVQSEFESIKQSMK